MCVAKHAPYRDAVALHAVFLHEHTHRTTNVVNRGAKRRQGYSSALKMANLRSPRQPCQDPDPPSARQTDTNTRHTLHENADSSTPAIETQLRIRRRGTCLRNGVHRDLCDNQTHKTQRQFSPCVRGGVFDTRISRCVFVCPLAATHRAEGPSCKHIHTSKHTERTSKSKSESLDWPWDNRVRM